MRYTLFLHYPELTAEDLGEEVWEAGKAAFHVYAEALDDAGVLVSAEVLQPAARSTTVMRKDGDLRRATGRGSPPREGPAPPGRPGPGPRRWPAPPTAACSRYWQRRQATSSWPRFSYPASVP